ncbi:protein of unknown function DUF1684 [Rhodobacter ferrooxidans]|uniref:DUF1684 domain-containing protein n=2 Tax=Rhodobacter ferrooxidans TaxID=371731 RepID=C8RZY4_9RHOB|nr:protein of unknown function DUF1684 [Rhodobacter sp. SW2]
MIDPAYADTLADWRAARLADLAAEDGWLNLTDRLELTPGTHRVGSAADNDLVLTAGPAHLGVLVLDDDGRASLRTEGGAALPFQPQPETPARLRHAGLLLELHVVEGAPALRVRDIDAPYRRNFNDLRYFPTNPAWCIRAAWQAFDAPQALAIDMVNGVASSVTLTHRAVFQHDGQRIDLLPTHLKQGKPMFVFRDRTAGQETYAASRFLFGEDASDGQITLDFNKAFNPPCAFTDHAICPLPPQQNILPFRIEAGELLPQL